MHLKCGVPSMFSLGSDKPDKASAATARITKNQSFSRERSATLKF